MRILQLTSHLNVGGIPRYVLTLSGELAARGHSVAVVSEGGHLEDQLRRKGLVHWRLPLHTSAEFSPRVFQATRQLTKDAETSHIPVIIITTKDQETDKVWGTRQGAKDYLTKPVDEETLIKTLNSVLAG